MAIRILWDKYETAILISACVDYNAGKCTKKEATKHVSQTLLMTAKHNLEYVNKTSSGWLWILGIREIQSFML